MGRYSLLTEAGEPSLKIRPQCPARNQSQYRSIGGSRAPGNVSRPGEAGELFFGYPNQGAKKKVVTQRVGCAVAFRARRLIRNVSSWEGC